MSRAATHCSVQSSSENFLRADRRCRTSARSSTMRCRYKAAKVVTPAKKCWMICSKSRPSQKPSRLRSPSLGWVDTSILHYINIYSPSPQSGVFVAYACSPIGSPTQGERSRGSQESWVCPHSSEVKCQRKRFRRRASFHLDRQALMHLILAIWKNA